MTSFVRKQITCVITKDDGAINKIMNNFRKYLDNYDPV